MNDNFFAKRNCDRCRNSLEGKARKMSWFTEECLCEDCIEIESQLKTELSQKGIDISKLEGCGYIPQLKIAVQNIINKYNGEK